MVWLRVLLAGPMRTVSYGWKHVQEDQESFTKKYELNTADTHTVHIQKAV